MKTTTMYWLPEPEDHSGLSCRLPAQDGEAALIEIAKARANFVRIDHIDRVICNFYDSHTDKRPGPRKVKLAILSTSTTTHLHSSIRVAAFRRNLMTEIYEPSYGQFLAELTDRNSGLFRFSPQVVLFAFDARHVTGAFHIDMTETDVEDAAAELLDRWRQYWGIAQNELGSAVLQQSLLPVFPSLVGQNEQILPGTQASVVRRVNGLLRNAAIEASGVHLVAVDAFAGRDGLDDWYSPALWHRAKQEITPKAAPVYGDLVARLVGAQFGRSAKCLVLDLDNTLWGGVIGDDGLGGIALGQGSAEGEAFVEFQKYLRQLSRRGVILAVCSKNEDSVARSVFEKHPEMILRTAEISVFVANWEDKATNIRAIADILNIGLDSLVFFDDNPFERSLVRRELPLVAVPELPKDPALYAQTIADSGYFETFYVTDDDRMRTTQYRVNSHRQTAAASVTDLTAYLESLEMRLVWSAFDEIGTSRVVQLINKSNQFNLTTRRYSDAAIRQMMQDPDIFGLQLRLIDRFGDNGIISVLILKKIGDDALIDSWLMSCRVLGRGVEQATLSLLVKIAGGMGCNRLVGQYLPTAKNGLVERHYPALGFTEVRSPEEQEGAWFELALTRYEAPNLLMKIVAAAEVAA